MSNESAFPHFKPAIPQGIYPEGTLMPSGGMTLRDYFAGQVLIGLTTDSIPDPQWAAKEAYLIADAMIEVRDA